MGYCNHKFIPDNKGCMGCMMYYRCKGKDKPKNATAYRHNLRGGIIRVEYHDADGLPLGCLETKKEVIGRAIRQAEDDIVKMKALIKMLKEQR